MVLAKADSRFFLRFLNVFVLFAAFFMIDYQLFHGLLKGFSSPFWVS